MDRTRILLLTIVGKPITKMQITTGGIQVEKFKKFEMKPESYPG